MSPSLVYTKIPRCDHDLVMKASTFGVSDLHESLGVVQGRMSLMSHTMRPIQQGRRVAGAAITAYNYPGDNLMIHAALKVAEAGQFLVLTNGGGAHGALWGEVAATYATQKGLAGAIVDGPTRDTAELRALGFPVWTTVVSSSHPEKRGPGAVNVPVVCGGVLINPGDVIAADDDGVLVIPREMLAGVVERAEARQKREKLVRERLKAGESLYAMDDMKKLFETADIEFRESTWLKAKD